MLKLKKIEKGKGTQLENLKECIKNLANELNYSIAGLITLKNNNTMARLDIKHCVENTTSIKNNVIIRNLTKFNYILSLVIKESSIVVYKKDDDEDDYETFIENINNEMYIPLFIDSYVNEDMIGCIYLASSTKSEDDLSNEKTNELIHEINNIYTSIYLENNQLETSLNIIHTMSETIQTVEPHMVEHPYNVANWARAIGEKLNLDEETLQRLYIVSVIHDIGNIYIPAAILNKPSKLTDAEYNIIKKHPIYGSNIINDVFYSRKDLYSICNAIAHHHERYDGKGYPSGLKGDEIPLESRIIAVADSVDAMMSVRGYKKEKPMDYILKELKRNKGTQFDPEIADIMIDLLLKSKESFENVLSGQINWGSLTIYTIDKILTSEGTLVNYMGYYRFRSDKFNFTKKLNKNDIKKISLYIDKNNTIYEFDAVLDMIVNNTIYIKKLTMKPLPQSFNILWNLIGNLNYNEENFPEINITKIGGESLTFFNINEEIPLYLLNKILNIKVNFEDEDEAIVTGRIINRFKLGNKYYYELKYINTPDAVKDIIFKNLFRKQISLRRMVSNI